MPSHMGKVVLALGLAGLTLLNGCGCTAIGCGNLGATLDVDVTATPAQLDGGLFRVCRNERCTEHVMAIAGTKAVLASVRRDDLHIGLTGLVIEPVLAVPVTTNDDRDLRDGDIYTLELFGAGGGVVQSWRWEADYRERYPNGRDCQDYACRYVELTSDNTTDQSP